MREGLALKYLLDTNNKGSMNGGLKMQFFKFLVLSEHIVSAVIDNDDCITIMTTKELFSAFSCLFVH